MDNKLNRSQPCVHTAKTANKVICFSYGASRLMEVILLSTGEATPGVLGPVLGLPEQERHGFSKKNPVQNDRLAKDLHLWKG